MENILTLECDSEQRRAASPGEERMSASLRALLTGLIDYAGLFPPAKLPLDQSIQNYLRYRRDLDRWMLGQFVCPVARLSELEPYLREELRDPLLQFGISALGRGGNTTDEFLINLHGDQFAIDMFHAGYGKQAIVSSFEVRVPIAFVFSPAAPAMDLPQSVKVTRDRADGDCLPVMTYWEPAVGADWRTSISALVHSLSTDRIGKKYAMRRSGRPHGLKLRCGGVEPSAFPAPEQVAFTIAACRDAGVSNKFTAGLHHPIRHYDSGLSTKMHGFVNVFGAGVLAHSKRISEQKILAIIEDEDRASFVFTEDEFRWRDLRATTAEITEARRQGVISFSSCSFDEPREDLRKLGWLS
jgi:hypothetical protein